MVHCALAAPSPAMMLFAAVSAPSKSSIVSTRFVADSVRGRALDGGVDASFSACPRRLAAVITSSSPSGSSVVGPLAAIPAALTSGSGSSAGISDWAAPATPFLGLEDGVSPSLFALLRFEMNALSAGSTSSFQPSTVSSRFPVPSSAQAKSIKDIPPSSPMRLCIDLPMKQNLS